MRTASPTSSPAGSSSAWRSPRALVMEPKVLLMDEPLSNLDAKLREQMRTEIRRIQQRLGITSVYVTHDQVEAMTLSDQVVVMNQGKIEQIGTPAEVYRRPAHPLRGRLHRPGQLRPGDGAGRSPRRRDRAMGPWWWMPGRGRSRACTGGRCPLQRGR